ncbi:hypothetical protein, partial [Pseudomonas bijieensis]|uniref:hypothetical protein n=1 Tax=Pseudomonas bijieensis TaxID=2681983 RepID=UPI001E60D78B
AGLLAKTVCQLANVLLTHRFREQARSHNVFQGSVFILTGCLIFRTAEAYFVRVAVRGSHITRIAS